MTQLENILSHFKDLAYEVLSHGGNDDKMIELKEILESIENENTNLDKLIDDHRRSNGTFGSDWNISDIQTYAQENEELELSDDEAWEIANKIEVSEDANEGINWGVIGMHLDSWIERKKQNESGS